MAPPAEHVDTIGDFVSSIALRLRRLADLQRVCLGLTIGVGIAIVYLVVARAVGIPRAPWSFLAAAIPVPIALLIFFALARKPMPDYAAAKLADDRLDLKDQLAGAFDFTAAGRDDVLVRMAIAQTAGKLTQPGLTGRAVPLRVPRSLWSFLVLGVLCTLAHRGLFPPPAPKLSEATRRELEEGRESIEGLLALEADLSDEQQKKEFERIRKLIEDLNLMSEDATKEEILARLSREIADLDAQADKADAMARALDELKKYRDRVAMGDLMDELQEELDKGAEELAVDDGAGGKVSAEAIKTLALVDKQALAEKRAKKDELAKELKGVAKTQREKAEAAAKQWDLATKKEKVGEGEKKELKAGSLTYDALRDAVESRDIRAMILKAAGDRDRSSEPYREVYDNYKRILESVLYEQRVPSGQQLYVRRYFKIIRPRED